MTLAERYAILRAIVHADLIAGNDARRNIARAAAILDRMDAS